MKGSGAVGWGRGAPTGRRGRPGADSQRPGRRGGPADGTSGIRRPRWWISNADPKRTFLGLVGREHLPAEFLAQIEAYRCEGSSFKINLALGELPSYSALPGTVLGPLQAARPHLRLPGFLEHAWDEAKYGAPSTEPLLEITIPTAYDSSLAPEGKHIMSIFAQYAPYRLARGTWDDQTRAAFVDRAIGRPKG